METILLITRLILAAVFAVAGIAKLFDLKGSQKAVADFGAPKSAAKLLGVLLPIFEVAIALLLLPVATAWFAGMAALGLLFVFVGGIVYNIWRGNAPDCHCFGQIHSEPVGWSVLIRNLILAAIAGFVVVFGRQNAGAGVSSLFDDSTAVDKMNIILGIVIIGLLAYIAVTLKQIFRQQIVLQRQIEVLGLSAGEERSEQKHEDATTPAAGFPVGAVAPDFVLPAANGGQISLRNLTSEKKPVLLFFVSPTCAPCAALLPEIESWKMLLGAKLNFVFVSSGAATENLEKFGTDNIVLLQKERETMELFLAKWTPTAVLINADGTIGSRLATGDGAIRRLIETIKPNLSNGHVPQSLFVADKAAKIGQTAPEFALPDLNGRKINSADLRGKKTMLLFWGTTCGFCQQILEEVRDWERLPAEKRAADLVVVSRGGERENREQNFKSPVLLENDGELMGQFGGKGTPSAVIIDENGKIASEVAVGAAEVFALVGKYKNN